SGKFTVGRLMKDGGPGGKLNPAKSQSDLAHSALTGHMLQICSALRSTSDTNGQLPTPAYAKDPTVPDAKALLSWRVTILPYLGESSLYKEFKLDEPWDSPNNLKLLPKMPKIFRSLGDQTQREGFTHLQLVTGAGTLFPTQFSKVKIPEACTDG